MLRSVKWAYYSTISFSLKPIVKHRTFEYSKDTVQLEDEFFSENSKTIYINAWTSIKRVRKRLPCSWHLWSRFFLIHRDASMNSSKLVYMIGPFHDIPNCASNLGYFKREWKIFLFFSCLEVAYLYSTKLESSHNKTLNVLGLDPNYIRSVISFNCELSSI